MSPTNPDVLYYGGNVVFKTTDGGRNWIAISPDLTTDDKEKQKSSGGPISQDNTRAEFHCTIVSLAESPRDPTTWPALPRDRSNSPFSIRRGKRCRHSADPAMQG